MIETMAKGETRSIAVEEVFPHSPEVVWMAITDGDLIARFLMPPSGFAPVPGTKFTFLTKPAGAWDGSIRCEVLEVIPREKLVYSWKGGHQDNSGYGSLLDTVVTWALFPTADGGTRLSLLHSGFDLPRNEMAFANMGAGWKTIIPRMGPLLDQPVQTLPEEGSFR